MKTPLQIISDYGCPTHSMVSAAQFFNDRGDLSYEDYKKSIQQLIASPELPETESYHFAKVLFNYIVQETIRAYNIGMIPLMDELYEACIVKARKWIDENPWSATMFYVTHGMVEQDEIDPETGVITNVSALKSKGAKKDITERIFNDMKSKHASRQDIINAFVTQTGMSKAGATTYFHALKKDLGFTETLTTETKLTKSENKQELAERLYVESNDKSKPMMISLFIDKLATSKLGAQTYFYSCKKKYEHVKSTSNIT